MKTINDSAVNTVLEFMARINQHDVDKLAEYMTEDHVAALHGCLMRNSAQQQLQVALLVLRCHRTGGMAEFPITTRFWVGHDGGPRDSFEP